MGIVGLSLVATRGSAVTACPSACTRQLATCKEMCPGGGQERRDCRAACAERGTCTAPGARIRTLAYVVTECTMDPQGLTSLQQTFFIRRGNCDPVPVMVVGPSTPAPDPDGLCLEFGTERLSYEFIRTGVFQHMTVLPDASGALFDVTKQFSETPAVTPEPSEEGIFFVRADGSGLRKLGPASRVQARPGGFLWGVSPDARTVTLIDLGPATAGYEAPQVFLLDVRSGQRRQLMHQPRIADLDIEDPGIWFPSFLNRRTIGFYSGSTGGSLRAFQVKTDGGGETEIPPITLPSGAHIVSEFGVTGAHPHVIFGLFPDRDALNRPDPRPGAFVREIFLIAGKSIVQLTAFNRSDTAPGGAQAVSPIVRGRVLFVASANPFGENPGEICQVFSISTTGDHLRQLTHLPWDGRPSPLGCKFEPPGCGVVQDIAADQVTGAVLFSSSCDPVGANPFGDQLFAMRLDGTDLRQLTRGRGMTTDADGTVHVELVGPFAYAQPGLR